MGGIEIHKLAQCYTAKHANWNTAAFSTGFKAPLLCSQGSVAQHTGARKQHAGCMAPAAYAQIAHRLQPVTASPTGAQLHL
jgi:hypothetical protein